MTHLEHPPARTDSFRWRYTSALGRIVANPGLREHGSSSCVRYCLYTACTSLVNLLLLEVLKDLKTSQAARMLLDGTFAAVSAAQSAPTEVLQC